MPKTKPGTPKSLSSSGKRKIDPSWMKVQNNVCTSSLSKPLNLNQLTSRIPSFGSSTPNHFSAAVVRLVDSEYSTNSPFNKFSKRITGNFFRSGRVVLTGSKNRKTATHALSTFLGMLKEKYDTELVTEDVSLRNVVVTIKIPDCEVDLEKLSYEKMNSCSYDPENFPGLTMSFPYGHTPTANIFKSGNIVLPGASNLKYAKECADFVYDKVFPYLKAKNKKKNTHVPNFD